MRITLLLCIVIFPLSAWSQIDSPRPYKPLHADLFRRAQSSELLAIVTVVDRRGVGTRISNEELMRSGDISKTYGGSLYTLQVEEILCAKADFDVKARKARSKTDKLLVFKDRIDGEYYQLGHEYLVFLIPHHQQQNLATKYRLEAGATYYEAFEGEKGLIGLPSEEPQSVTKIRKFCGAVSAADRNVKIRELTNLLGSGDNQLELAAGQAIDFFHGQMMWR